PAAMISLRIARACARAARPDTAEEATHGPDDQAVGRPVGLPGRQLLGLLAVGGGRPEPRRGGLAAGLPGRLHRLGPPPPRRDARPLPGPRLRPGAAGAARAAADDAAARPGRRPPPRPARRRRLPPPGAARLPGLPERADGRRPGPAPRR